jgi:hypothetical protein
LQPAISGADGDPGVRRTRCRGLSGRSPVSPGNAIITSGSTASLNAHTDETRPRTARRCHQGGDQGPDRHLGRGDRGQGRNRLLPATLSGHRLAACACSRGRWPLAQARRRATAGDGTRSRYRPRSSHSRAFIPRPPEVVPTGDTHRLKSQSRDGVWTLKSLPEGQLRGDQATAEGVRSGYCAVGMVRSVASQMTKALAATCVLQRIPN